MLHRSHVVLGNRVGNVAVEKILDRMTIRQERRMFFRVFTHHKLSIVLSHTNVKHSCLAHPVCRGDGLRSNPTKAPRRALPRFRTLCTNSKKPRYSGSFSCEIPRCGRSQLRNNDQNPSIVLTCTSQKPSPSSSRANSPAA